MLHFFFLHHLMFKKRQKCYYGKSVSPHCGRGSGFDRCLGFRATSRGTKRFREGGFGSITAFPPFVPLENTEYFMRYKTSMPKCKHGPTRTNIMCFICFCLNTFTMTYLCTHV